MNWVLYVLILLKLYMIKGSKLILNNACNLRCVIRSLRLMIQSIMPSPTQLPTPWCTCNLLHHHIHELLSTVLAISYCKRTTSCLIPCTSRIIQHTTTSSPDTSHDAGYAMLFPNEEGPPKAIWMHHNSIMPLSAFDAGRFPQPSCWHNLFKLRFAGDEIDEELDPPADHRTETGKLKWQNCYAL